jgi:hypothetical protein
MRCPGSIRLCANLEETESEYAAEGTFAHHIAALCLEQKTRAVEMVGETDGRFAVDFDMADYLQDYLDVVNSLTGELRIEEEVVVDANVYGTADAVVISNKTLHVLDLKYGAGVYVQVQQNPQLMIYALGALEFAPAARKVNLHVVQPRCSAPVHRTWKIDAQSLREWGEKTLLPAIVKCFDADAPLSAGDHCHFCEARATCPALREKVQLRTREVFATKKPPDVHELTPQQLGEILEVAPLVDMGLKAVREHAFTQLRNGTAIPGYKLVHRKSNREWECEALARCAGIPVVQKLLSPAQAEKRIGKEIVAELVAPQTQSTIMVQESDKRDALPLGSPFEDESENTHGG